MAESMIYSIVILITLVISFAVKLNKPVKIKDGPTIKSHLHGSIYEPSLTTFLKIYITFIILIFLQDIGRYNSYENEYNEFFSDIGRNGWFFITSYTSFGLYLLYLITEIVISMTLFLLMIKLHRNSGLSKSTSIAWNKLVIGTVLYIVVNYVVIQIPFNLLVLQRNSSGLSFSPMGLFGNLNLMVFSFILFQSGYIKFASLFFVFLELIVSVYLIHFLSFFINSDASYLSGIRINELAAKMWRKLPIGLIWIISLSIMLFLTALDHETNYPDTTSILTVFLNLTIFNILIIFLLVYTWHSWSKTTVIQNGTIDDVLVEFDHEDECTTLFEPREKLDQNAFKGIISSVFSYSSFPKGEYFGQAIIFGVIFLLFIFLSAVFLINPTSFGFFILQPLSIILVFVIFFYLYISLIRAHLPNTSGATLINQKSGTLHDNITFKFDLKIIILILSSLFISTAILITFLLNSINFIDSLFSYELESDYRSYYNPVSQEDMGYRYTYFYESSSVFYLYLRLILIIGIIMMIFFVVSIFTFSLFVLHGYLFRQNKQFVFEQTLLLFKNRIRDFVSYNLNWATIIGIPFSLVLLLIIEIGFVYQSGQFIGFIFLILVSSIVFIFYYYLETTFRLYFRLFGYDILPKAKPISSYVPVNRPRSQPPAFQNLDQVGNLNITNVPQEQITQQNTIVQHVESQQIYSNFTQITPVINLSRFSTNTVESRKRISILRKILKTYNRIDLAKASRFLRLGTKELTGIFNQLGDYGFRISNSILSIDRSIIEPRMEEVLDQFHIQLQHSSFDILEAEKISDYISKTFGFTTITQDDYQNMENNSLQSLRVLADIDMKLGTMQDKIDSLEISAAERHSLVMSNLSPLIGEIELIKELSNRIEEQMVTQDQFDLVLDEIITRMDILEENMELLVETHRKDKRIKYKMEDRLKEIALDKAVDVTLEESGLRNRFRQYLRAPNIADMRFIMSKVGSNIKDKSKDPKTWFKIASAIFLI